MRRGDSGGDNPLDDARIMRARSGDLSRHDDGSLGGRAGSPNLDLLPFDSEWVEGLNYLDRCQPEKLTSKRLW